MSKRPRKHALEEFRTVTSPEGKVTVTAVCRCGFETAQAPRRDYARVLYNEHRSVKSIDDPAQAVWKAEKAEAPDKLREGYDRAVEPAKQAAERERFESFRKKIEERIMQRRWTHDLE